MTLPLAAVPVVAGLFGLLLGSFLNVCIFRLPRGVSVVWPASACGGCKRELRWFENIPIVSWVVLGARCARCKAPISIQYPLVEAVTAVLFVVVAAVTPVSPLLAARLIFVCALIVLFTIDLEHQILPNVITLPGISVGLAFALLGPPGWRAALLGVVLGGGVLYATAAGYYLLRKEEGLGMGDVKMLAMIGAFLGWQAVIFSLTISAVIGAIVGITLIAFRKQEWSSRLPYGPYIALAAMIWIFAHQQILPWWLVR